MHLKFIKKSAVKLTKKHLISQVLGTKKQEKKDKYILNFLTFKLYLNMHL